MLILPTKFWCLWGPSIQKGQFQKDSDRSSLKCESFPQIMNYFRNGFAFAARLIDLMFKMFQQRTQFHHHSRAVQTAAPPTPCPPPPRSSSSISSSRCFSSSSTTSTSNPLTGASTCQNKEEGSQLKTHILENMNSLSPHLVSRLPSQDCKEKQRR